MPALLKLTPVTSRDKNKILMTRIVGERRGEEELHIWRGERRREEKEIIVLKMDIRVTSCVSEDAKEERCKEVNPRKRGSSFSHV